MNDFFEIVEIERYVKDRILKQYDLLKNGYITECEYIKIHSDEMEILKKVKRLNNKIFEAIR